MQALICDAFAPIEQLRNGELPEPTPGPGEVLIRVEAAGVNFYDTLIVQGQYQVKPALPFSPGGEVAGTVVAVGEPVSAVVGAEAGDSAGDPVLPTFSVGDRVCAFTSYGGFAQLCVAKSSQTWALPDPVTMDSAAAGLVAYGTAWFALHDRARLRAGETVVVLGAAGGVGLAAVQIAHAAGARVIAAAGSAERLALCHEAGATAGIDYTQEDLRDAIRRQTGGRGADVVIDVVGGAYTEAALRAMAWRGRLQVIGFAAGEIPRLPANLLLLKGCEAAGVFWDEFLRREPEAAATQVAAILRGFGAGTLRPRITEVLPLERARDALFALARRKAPGKLVVTPATDRCAAS